MVDFSDNIGSIPLEDAAGPVVHDVEFKGTTEEYFGIWIVNVLLSIVTLGVYSAWAKVRNKKYFSGVTFIDGHNFDYHATGIQIFIGRVLVLVFYLMLNLGPLIHPYLGVIAFILLMLILGWVIKQAIGFNARMTSYRNVRFEFQGSAGGAWLRFVLFPALIYLGLFGGLFLLLMSSDSGAMKELGIPDIGSSGRAVFGILAFVAFIMSILLFPVLTRSINRYTINNYQYGDRDFDFDSGMQPYYIGFFKMIGLIILVFAVFGLLIGMASIGEMTSSGGPSSGVLFLITILYPFFLIGFFAAGIVYRVAVRNITFNNTILDDKHELISTFSTPRLTFIIVTNALAVVFSFGLAMPWARIRLARYVAENTKLVAGGDLGGYSSSVIETHGVTAAEYADIEGFDIDLGIGF